MCNIILENILRKRYEGIDHRNDWKKILYVSLSELLVWYFAEVNKVLRDKNGWSVDLVANTRKISFNLLLSPRTHTLANCILIIHTFSHEFLRQLRILCHGKNPRTTADCACTEIPRLKDCGEIFSVFFLLLLSVLQPNPRDQKRASFFTVVPFSSTVRARNA